MLSNSAFIWDEVVKNENAYIVHQSTHIGELNFFWRDFYDMCQRPREISNTQGVGPEVKLIEAFGFLEYSRKRNCVGEVENHFNAQPHHRIFDIDGCFAPAAKQHAVGKLNQSSR